MRDYILPPDKNEEGVTHMIYINEDPISEDNRTNLICETKDGSLHEVNPVIGFEDTRTAENLEKEGWKKIQAIRRGVKDGYLKNYNVVSKIFFEV